MPRYQRSRAEVAAARAGVGFSDRRITVAVEQTRTQDNLTTDNPCDKFPTSAWHTNCRGIFYQGSQ